MRRALIPALALCACATAPRPVPAPAERALAFRLDPDEDPTHALAVASRRLAARGVTRADVTAATGSLSVRLPAADADRAREALTSLAWLRARVVDERVDLGALISEALPAGVSSASEPVTLAAGLTMRSLAVYATEEGRPALAALAASIHLRDRELVLAPRAGGWQLLAVEIRATLHGGHVRRCVAETAGRVALTLDADVARADAAQRGTARRAVFEVDGVPRALGPLAVDPTLVFDRIEDAAALAVRCAEGMLRGPVTAE